METLSLVSITWGAGKGSTDPSRQAAQAAGFSTGVLELVSCSQLCFLPPPGREIQVPLEILQLDFEMENFTSQSVKRRIMWHIDYRGQGALPDLERAVTELTVIQRDVQAILPLAMVSRAGDRASGCSSLSWVHA